MSAGNLIATLTLNFIGVTDVQKPPEFAWNSRRFAAVKSPGAASLAFGLFADV